jgi:hypothetical protein
MKREYLGGGKNKGSQRDMSRSGDDVGDESVVEHKQ